MRGVLIALWAAACSPSVPAAGDAPTSGSADSAAPDPNEGATSGTRLKLTWINFADGTRTWNSFYDSQRKENCYIYENWADGNAYCAPDTMGSIAYTDASCSQRFIQIYRDPGCALPPASYTMEFNDGPCASPVAHLWQRGGTITVTNYYYRFSDGSCGGPYSAASYDNYALGPEVAPSTLVQLMLGSPAGAARLGERFYQSADGMKVPWTIHDAQLGVDCYPAYTPDYSTMTTCAPSATGAGNYHDSACSQPEVAVSMSCPAPKYIVNYPQNACPDQPGQFYAAGAMVSASPLFQQSGASCTATTGSTALSYYLTGQPLTLAPLARSIDAAAGHRIQLVHYSNSEGLKMRDYTLYDTQSAAQCYPEKLPDGTIRCVPFGGYVQTFYTNSSCTTAIDLIAIDSGMAGCAAPTVPKYARKYIQPPPGSCAYSTEVHPVATRYSGTVYQNFGTCTPYNQSLSQLYSIGPAVPITDFVTASITTDP